MKQESNGHDAAWLQHVFERFEGPLVRYAARLVGDLDRGRDIVQDTFVKLCRQSPRPDETQIAAWLYTVCRNRSLDVHKKERRMTQLPTRSEDASTSSATDPALVAEQNETFFNACVMLKGLPENQQEVIRLKIEHGLSYREIGKVTGLSVSNVGYLLHQGLQSVRRKLINERTEQA